MLTFLSPIAVLCIAFLVWRIVVAGGDRGFFRRVLPPGERRDVPWGVAVIVPVLMLVLGVSMLSQLAVHRLMPGPVFILHEENGNVAEHVEFFEPAESETGETAETSDDAKLSEQHPLAVLMQKGGQYPVVLVVCFLLAVIIAPLSEELIFRVIMQCGIESTLHRELNGTIAARWFSILLTALFFAAIHIRPQTSPDVDALFKGIVGGAVGSLVSLALIAVLFRGLYRIRWADFGLCDFRLLGRDALGALLLLVMILVPVFVVNGAVYEFAQTDWAVQRGISSSWLDPIPLFLFAMVIGSLYYRTRRLAPVFFLHAFFNLFSFLVSLYLAFYGS